MNYGLWWILLDVYENLLTTLLSILVILIILKSGFLLFADNEYIQQISYKNIDPGKLRLKVLKMISVSICMLLVIGLLPSKKVLIEAFVIQKSANILSNSHKLSDSDIGKIIDLSVQKIENALNSSK